MKSFVHYFDSFHNEINCEFLNIYDVPIMSFIY